MHEKTSWWLYAQNSQSPATLPHCAANYSAQQEQNGYHSVCCSPDEFTGAGHDQITMASLICLVGLHHHTLTQFDPQASQPLPGAFPLLMPNDRALSFLLFSLTLAKAQTVLLTPNDKVFSFLFSHPAWQKPRQCC